MSPVSLNDLLRMIDGVLGVQLSEDEGQRLLKLVVSCRKAFSIGCYRFRLEIVDALHCWLHYGESAGGLNMCLRNTEAGVLIQGIRDLGGGQRCGSFTLK